VKQTFSIDEDLILPSTVNATKDVTGEIKTRKISSDTYVK
jgi:hypothetical protein